MSKFAVEGVGMVMAAQDGHSSCLRKYFDWRIRRFGFVTFSNTLVPRHVILKVKQLLNVHVGEDTLYAMHIHKMGMKNRENI